MRAWAYVPILILAACSSETIAPSVAIAPHDVSILFPLPANERDRTLLDFRELGTHGRILPKFAIDALPPLTDATLSAWAWNQLRLVAVRFDPCFASVEDGPACVNQVRFVWQPVGNETNGEGVTTMDAAVHSFYEVPREELLASIRKLRESSGSRSSDSLGVHPVLVEQGMTGAFGKDLKAELLALTGEKRLRRVTFMTLPIEKHEWVFGGFDVKDGATAPLKPVGIPDELQRISGSVSTDGTSIARVTNVANEDVRPALLGGGARLSDAEATGVYAAALRLENPRVYTPETTDCASCHLARAARTVIEGRAGFAPSSQADRHADTIRPASGPPGSFRAFGYFGKEPSVSARVSHETEEVAAMVGRLLATK